jgi:nicotinamidase-related amidase
MKQAHGIPIPRTLDDVCTSGRLALLIYDVQVGIVRQVPAAGEIVGRVSQVLDAAREVGMRTIFTRHMSLPRELMGAFQYRMAMAWQGVDDPAAVEPWFLRDSPGFAIVPELAPLASEAVFDKITMSAFEGTPLHITLRDCGISAIAIAGIAMEVGIEPTARHAADLGIIPVIIADACGAGNPDAAQRSLDSLAFTGDALITDAATFCRLIRPRPD